jgi:RNA-directed DNA polymerase
VKGVFQSLGYSPAVSTIFGLLATEAPRKQVAYAGQTFEVATGPRVLPQGAATSPALSNLTARRLDNRLSGIAVKLGWTYTRYADDLTFSADGEAADKIGYLLARIRHITEDEGFTVNEKKTRVQRPNTAQVVTGLVVNQHVAVPREAVRRLRAILHRAGREGLAAQNRDNHPHFEAWVRGMIAYITMVDPDQGRKLRAAYDALAH